MKTVYRLFARLLSRINSKHKVVPPSVAHFDRQGPNRYIRRLDGQLFTLRQLTEMEKEAATRNKHFIVHRWSDIPLATREEDIVM